MHPQPVERGAGSEKCDPKAGALPIHVAIASSLLLLLLLLLLLTLHTPEPEQRERVPRGRAAGWLTIARRARRHPARLFSR